MTSLDHQAFNAGKAAAQAGRSCFGAFDDLQASTQKQNHYFLLGYFESYNPNENVTKDKWAFNNLQEALDEFFSYVADASKRKEYQVQKNFLHERLIEFAPNTYEAFRDALFNYLEDIKRCIWLRGISTAMIRKEEYAQDARLYGLDAILALPHIRKDDSALNLARIAIQKELEVAMRLNLILYERVITMDYFRLFPWWFNHGYYCGVELGARTIQRFRENKGLTEALKNRFFL